MSNKTLSLLSPARILDQLDGDATLPTRIAALRQQLVAAAREDVAGHPVMRRRWTLEEVRADPDIRMKYREHPAHLAHLDEAGWERFALSLADTEMANTLAQRLPRIAAAARITGDAALADYACRQIAELASWSPLVRPGWSGAPHPDGAWLGTGWAVRTITETLALLPEDVVADSLRDAVRARLRAEAAGVRDDWARKPNWFTQQEAAYSNQWVLPNEALVLACLHLGLEAHREDYEFGVANLLRSLKAQGERGEFVEGLNYGAITLASVLSAARAAALIANDTRLLEHPFFQKFPVWYLHHLQPGGFFINAFDARLSEINHDLVAELAVATGHPCLGWFLRHFPAPASTLIGTRGVTLPVFLAECAPALGVAAEAAPPPRWAHYPVTARVNWVESWDGIDGRDGKGVSGFWIRGGHATDTHDHQDRGHVNFIVKGRPVLIEAGLLSYGIPEHPTHFKSVAGHNVLQVGGYAPAELAPQVLADGAGQILDAAHRSAPLTVNRLDAAGGEVSVDGSACYAGVRRWVRRVTWDAESVRVCDEVELPAPDVVLFRWHLGVDADAPRVVEAGRVEVGGIVVVFEAPAASSEAGEAMAWAAGVEAMPDNTLTPGALHRHAAVVVRAASPALRFLLETRIGLARLPG